MSRYSGAQGKGAAHRMRELKRAQAQARQAEAEERLWEEEFTASLDYRPPYME